ncbi:unnamed protein product [Rhizophagus irregularis]|nr:unnamed protein product [Rhizophagus irregularis]
MSSILPPELLSHIFSIFETDSDTLFSCCLVSREWSLSAVYWLWKKPFHICPTQNRMLLVRTCLKFISDDRFYDNIEQPPLFNYASFLQHLNFHEIYDAVWHYYNFRNKEGEYVPIPDEEKRLFMEQDLDVDAYYEFNEQDNNYYEFVEEEDNDWNSEELEDNSQDYDWNSEELEDFSQDEVENLKDKILLLTSKLCQIFLLHSNKIISLNLCTSEMDNGNDICEKWINIFKLENASSALANLKKFVSGGLYDLQSIINIMINICHDIEILEIIFEDDNFIYSFSNLTKSLKNLKELKVIGMNKYNFNGMIDSFSYQSHSLRILHFEDCVFNNDIPFKEISLLQNLESLILIDCEIDNINNIKSKSINYSFPSLKKIHFDMGIPSMKEIVRLISRSSNLEEIFLIELKLHTPNIFDIIANGCSNIKVLDMCVGGDHNIESIIPIFTQCQQLESISLRLSIKNKNYINKSMGILAKSIPKNLNNLILMISIEIGDLEAFFSQFDGLLKVVGFKMFDYVESDDLYNLNIEIQKYAERKLVNYRIVSSNRCDQFYIEFDI